MSNRRTCIDILDGKDQENGGELSTLKKLMGHESISITQKYLRPSFHGATEVINMRNRKAALHIAMSA
jgi:integrase